MIQNVDLYKLNQIASASASEVSSQTEASESTQAFSQVLKSVHTDANKTTDTTAIMEDIFVRASEKYQVPINLLKAVAKAESGYNPNAVSACGAQGVMQLMPSTAESLGVKDSFNPEDNIMGGAKYLSMMLDNYDGDVKLALAAYNAGAGNVAKYGGIPPFKETQSYVKKVTGFMEEDLGIISTKIPEKAQDAAVKESKEPKEPLVFTLTQSDKEFTYDDYVRFMELYQEEKYWMRLMSLYQN